MIKTLHKSILVACPITGVSIGRVNDKSTWRIDFHQSATQEQKNNALLTIAKFDVASTVANEKVNSDVETAARLELRNDAVIKAIQSMSPSQAKDWVNSTVNTLEESKKLLGVIVAVSCVLARRI